MPAPVETPYLRPAFLSATVATVLSLAVSATFVVVAQGPGDVALGSVWRTAVRTWLVALGSGIDAGSFDLGLVPIGASLAGVVLVALATSWVVADPLDDLAAFAATVAGAYGVIAGIAAAAAGSGGAQISPVRAAAAAFVVGGLGAIAGMIRRHGGADRWWFTTSESIRTAVRAALPGAAAVLGASAVIFAVLLALNVSQAGDMWALLDPGAGGGLALAAGSVLAVPTLVLWTASVLIGPGFALGTDTSVDLTGAQLGQVPGFPVLAALPGPGEFPDWVFVLGLVPLLAGMLSGWRVEAAPGTDLARRLALGAGAGAVAGFVLGVLIGLSSGSIGPGRMAETGPPTYTPLLVAVPVMAMGGVLGAALGHYRGARASRPSDTSATGRPRLWKRHQSPGTDRRVDDI